MRCFLSLILTLLLVSTAEAAVQFARAYLANTSIRAPFDGTVLRKDAEVGEEITQAKRGVDILRVESREYDVRHRGQPTNFLGALK